MPVVDVDMVDSATPGERRDGHGVAASECGAVDAKMGSGDGAGTESGGAREDIRSFFGATDDCTVTSIPGASDTASAGLIPSPDGVLSAFNLAVSPLQDVSESVLARSSADNQDHSRLAASVLAEAVALAGMDDVVPLLVATAPLMASGRAILAQLPDRWLDVYARSDALGTRCLFASRRHEHSIFAPVGPEHLLRVPGPVREWQPPLDVPAEAAGAAQLAAEEPWAMQLHPARGAVRVLLRPGALLARMLRRGTALPAARFSWRVLDTSREGAATGRGPRAAVPGGFSILSNAEDAAHTQPPHFLEFPLRREQLRSLGWMVSQERRRHEPFVTELRESAPCADAPHWQLEGRLQCEYAGVKGGVLADAIGYGKTACTIGLVDCTRNDPVPHVPAPFVGFIPTRATLVLCPTNLHAQWLGEITKFTGRTLNVLSVPTCSQLKRLSLQELLEADVVVATYRLFYSAPYLRRLSALVRAQRPGFAFPALPGAAGAGARRRRAAQGSAAAWASAYRTALEALPGWVAGLPRGSTEPETPARVPERLNATGGTPAKEEAPPATEGLARRYRGKTRAIPVQEEETARDVGSSMPAAAGEAAATPPRPIKRRRLSRKQMAWQPEERNEAACRGWSAEALGTEYVPLEALWWKRVVCDEFHELLSRYPPAQVAVEHFHADYKWGLSGTPPCETLAQIRKAAGFLGVQLPAAAAEDTGGEAPRLVAQCWLDAFVRRNMAELPPLEEEECIVPVQQTPRERALYLALTGQRSGSAEPALEEPPELQAARRSASGLLKLCSHFSACGAADVLTAEDECERQLMLRREEVRAAEREAQKLAARAAGTLQLVRHFEPHFCRAPERTDFGFILHEPRAAIAARLRFLGASTSGTKAELLTRLFGPSKSSSSPAGVAAAASEHAKEVALRVDFSSAAESQAETAKPPPTWAALEADATGDSGTSKGDARPGRDLVARVVREALACEAGKAGSPPPRCVRLRANLGMPACSGSRASGGQGAGPDFTPEELTWQWLAEGDNGERLRKVVNAWKEDIERCAARLRAVEEEAAAKLENLRSFQQTLHSPQVAAAWNMEETAPQFAKYGSKIEALVKHVQRLQQDERACKIICFVQWEDLKRKISLALEEFSIDHLSLTGSIWARRAALMKFQYEEDGPRMLLLSLEESASGTNLTASNHVIIVHPMEAATCEEAVAFEMQAVGRVRRPGQQRKIHIWRFVTIGTIEQHITEEHQKDLWERQGARVLAAPASPCLESRKGEEEEERGNRSLPVTEAGKAADAAEMCATQCYQTSELVDTADLATQCYFPSCEGVV